MILPDVNLLLYANDSSSPFHSTAAAWWQACLSGTEPVGLAHVAVFGFIRIATNTRVFKTPLTPGEAAESVLSWLEQPNVQILDPGPDHLPSTLVHLKSLGTAGNLVTDAQLATLALAHDAVLHTADADFMRFAGLRWFNPLTGMGSARPRRARGT
ncbi:MAG: type II toxin-antitoxin system VapC family toxin [Verrucomicrobiales bacterium]|nr:type II toxin-antitoxin system VapC family toxin [Verrucomicrobiales bacterium]